MSIKLIINVIKQCKRKPSEKLMLIVLSDFANDEAECFPSFETLASLCNISTRQAQNIIYALAQAGEIAISRREGGSNSYRLLNYLNPTTRETHCAGKPTKFFAKQPIETASTHEISDTTHETHFVTPPTKFSTTHEILSADEHLSHTPTHEIDFVPPTKFLSPTHETHFVTPTKPTSSEPVIEPIEPPREPVKANYVVAPVGDDTTRTPSVISDTPTVTEQIATPPTAETQPSGTIASPTVNNPKAEVPNPETPTTIEGNATSLDLAIVSDTEAHATQPPPVVPPREGTVTRKRAKPVEKDKFTSGEKAPRTYSDHQKMVGTICKVFGWDMSKLTRNNRSLVGKVARDLLEATATPADVQGLYDFCAIQDWRGTFGPAALTSQWANYYALKHKPLPDYIENEAGMIIYRFKPDPNYKSNIPEYIPSETGEFDDLLENIPNTPEERKAMLDKVIQQIAEKMNIPVEDIPEDDEMNEVLKW